MARIFKVGDHVIWNSEAGRVTGRIVRLHTRDVTYKGYVHHASPDDPQYEIKSDKTANREPVIAFWLCRPSWAPSLSPALPFAQC